jgi:DNA-binding NarL/FixJ family response regulator
MDNTLPKMDGIATTRLIKSQHSEIIVLGLSVDPKDYEIYAMQKAGAFDILKKDHAVTDLYAAIQLVVAAVQPVLVLAETESSKPLTEDSDQGEQLAPRSSRWKDLWRVNRPSPGQQDALAG